MSTSSRQMNVFNHNMDDKFADLPLSSAEEEDIGDGRFIYKFYHLLDMNRVLAGSPWTFNNHPLALHVLQKGEHPHRVSLMKIPFWVQIYDLPHSFMTERVGIQLGNFVGTFLEYDQSNRDAG
ncbi:hypothetical protein ACS0TY_017334 [Phlomoides rotata]